VLKCTYANEKKEEKGMEKGLQTSAVNHFFEAVLSLENKEECYQFFEDICTIKELTAIAQRLEVAKMLREERTYLDIAKETGASTATISRVNRSLNYGNEGLDMVLNRTKE
jgi:TrpR-related protein YerC/YecD